MQVKQTPAEETLDFQGWSWRTPPGAGVIVREATNAWFRNHLTPKVTNEVTGWVLNYFFTPVRVWHGTEQTWMERSPFVAHLYPHMFRYREDSRRQPRPPHGCWIKFDIEDQRRLSGTVINRYHYARFLDPDQLLGQRIIAIASVAATNQDKAYWSVSHMANSLIDDLTRAHPVDEGIYEVRKVASITERDTLADAVMGFLSVHLADPIGVDDVARHLRVSRSTVSHRFSRARGEGICEVLRRLRLLRAKSLLVRGMKLDAIAAETGFCDGRHLSKIFRQQEGIPPAEFLKRQAASV